MGIDKYSGNYTYCGTYALFDCFLKQTNVSMNQFEILTSVPFGVVHNNEYAHRIISPYCDPSEGMKKAAQILNLEYTSLEIEDSSEAYDILVKQLAHGAVVLGPLNMGKLDYFAKPSIYDKVPHYIAVYKYEQGRFYVNDPEGLIGYYIPEDEIMKAWESSDLYETKHAYNLKYVTQNKALASEEERIHRTLSNITDNLLNAKKEEQGPQAFLKLWETLENSGNQFYNNLFFDLEIFIQRKYLLLEFLEWADAKVGLLKKKELEHIATQQILNASKINYSIRRKKNLSSKEFFELSHKEDELTAIFKERYKK